MTRHRAFTLVEMLVVVVVLITLMTIAFRLSNVGADQQARNETISRIQRLENCLSGYYAAFGSYPPVALHASRNFRIRTNDSGSQDADGMEDGSLNWASVRAACLAQPVNCAFPFAHEGGEGRGIFENCDAVAEVMEKKFEGLGDPNGNAINNLEDIGLGASYSKAFEFGLLSFLLPRYLFMLDFDSNALSKLTQMKQWKNNNIEQHDPFDGTMMSWQQLRQYRSSATQGNNDTDLVRLANIPSQAVCARWMPNLGGMCNMNIPRSFFGISLGDGYAGPLSIEAPRVRIYWTGPNDSGVPYILDTITVWDGWFQDIYYYSPAPYQTYVLWSAGPNGKTFPPWVDKSSLNSSELKTVNEWISDDIIHMSN